MADTKLLKQSSLRKATWRITAVHYRYKHREGQRTKIEKLLPSQAVKMEEDRKKE